MVKPIGRQPFRFQRHLELLQIAADGQYLGDTGHRQQAFAQHIVGRVLEYHRPASADFCRVVPGQGDEHDFAHDRRRRRHHRRLDAGRQRSLRQLQFLGHHLARQIGIGAPGEFDRDGRQPDLGCRAHPAHAGRPVQRRFDGKGNQAFHVERRHAVRFGDHRHRRRGEVGKHVHRRARGLVTAPGQQHQTAEDDKQAVTQRPLNDLTDHVRGP
jgi:hypothetical protein